MHVAQGNDTQLCVFAHAEGAVQTSGSRSDRSSMESPSELANHTSDILAGADQGSSISSETWGNSGAGKQNSTGNIVQDLMKQPEAAMNPHRWNKILEVHSCSLSHHVDWLPVASAFACITLTCWLENKHQHVKKGPCRKVPKTAEKPLCLLLFAAALFPEPFQLGSAERRM